jgi:hypothetical protein
MERHTLCILPFVRKALSNHVSVSSWHMRIAKVKLSLCLTKEALRHKGVWGSGCIDPYFLDLSTSWRLVVSFTTRQLYPSKRAPDSHWIEGWVDPRAGLDNLEKRKFLTLPGLELRHLGRPSRSQSLYLLCYPGSSNWNINPGNISEIEFNNLLIVT